MCHAELNQAHIPSHSVDFLELFVVTVESKRSCFTHALVKLLDRVIKDCDALSRPTAPERTLASGRTTNRQTYVENRPVAKRPSREKVRNMDGVRFFRGRSVSVPSQLWSIRAQECAEIGQVEPKPLSSQSRP